MRTPAMIAQHQHDLDEVAQLIGKGWPRVRIAKAMGMTPGGVNHLVRELKRQGRIDHRRPDQAAAAAEFLKVLVLCSAESRRRLR